jgi:drug/metabolite transporter (DMT)-like permease
MFFAGTFVVLLLNGVWSLFVGTASMGGDESELVQGWSGVLRNSPAYLLLVVVAFLGVVFATKAGVHGSNRANAALIATSIALLFALASVTRDAAEVVMTTRAATVAWIAFAVDVIAVVIVHVVARRAIGHASSH